MVEAESHKILAVVTCDFERTAIGTRSRLGDVIAGKKVLRHVLDRLLAMEEVTAISLLVPLEQMERAREFADGNRVHIMELTPRSAGIAARVKAGRQWNLQAWRGGAGQYTVFDEEYHPAATAQACRQFAADHVLIVHSHGIFLDVPMTSALVRHHLHKNHEMKVTYTPSASGLCGMLLRADIVAEMGEKNVMPWQLLAYDPHAPTFDTLIREACMQVDPALSKIPNRFCVDTDRSWNIAVQCGGWLASSRSASELALAAARCVAPGIKDFSQIHAQPRELEIELTGKRLTAPPGSVPALIRESRGELDAAHWHRWFACLVRSRGFSLPPEQPKGCTPNVAPNLWDDVLLTFAGDGDPLLYADFPTVLRSARAGFLAICVQTDLACDNIDPLIATIKEGLIDVLSVTTYGHTAATYSEVAGADLHPQLLKNLTRLAPIISERGGVPLMIPRLLKVRDTIPEMEPFFDAWIMQSGWAVMEPPTDRAGGIPFAGVIDMAPPKRRPCRRLWDRMLIRANGNAVACDQDMNDRLTMGNIESLTLPEMWVSMKFNELRNHHAQGLWDRINPCQSCKEWHRA